MTSVGPAQRLLAELMESEPISAEPIAEVRADLAALGVDPAHVIAVTRRLVEGMDSPAAALLGRIEESERIDADSRDLLSADIATVYRQTDEGLAKSAIENARRMARSGAKVVPIRGRFYRRIYALGAAVAAALILFVGFSFSVSDCPWPYWLIPGCYTLGIHLEEPKVVALLIVEPELAPPSLRDARLPPGDLAQRLAEARVRARGLPVVALLSVRRPDGVVSDSAILAGSELVLREAAPVAAQEARPESTATTVSALQKITGPLPADLVVIDLPAK